MQDYDKMVCMDKEFEDYDKMVTEAEAASKTEVGAIRHGMNKWRRLSKVKSLRGVHIASYTCALCVRHGDFDTCSLNGSCCLIDSGDRGCRGRTSLYGLVDSAVGKGNVGKFRLAARDLYLRLRRALSQVDRG